MVDLQHVRDGDNYFLLTRQQEHLPDGVRPHRTIRGEALNLRPAMLTLTVVRGHGTDESRRRSFTEWSMMRSQGGWGLWKVESGRGTFRGIGGAAEQSFATLEACEQGLKQALRMVDTTLFNGMRPTPGLVREPWGYTQELMPGSKR